VADREDHEILVYRPDGDLDFKFGSRGSEPGEFFRPTAVAFDAIGDRFFVTDKDNHRVQMFNSRGEFLGLFGSKGKLPGQFCFPWGIAVSLDGSHIAVADTRNHRIQLFDSTCNFIREFRIGDPRNWKEYRHLFDYPRGLAFNPSGGVLYVTDFNVNVVLQIDIHCFVGFVPLTPPGILYRPSGIAVDDAGNILVCDTRHNSLRIFSPDGRLRSQVDSIGPSPLSLPFDVTLMKAGALALLDNNGRITIL